MNSENWELNRRKDEEKTSEIADVQVIVTKTELVTSLVCLVSVHNSRASSRNRVQVLDSKQIAGAIGIEPVHVPRKENGPGHNFGDSWSVHSEVWISLTNMSYVFCSLPFARICLSLAEMFLCESLL